MTGRVITLDVEVIADAGGRAVGLFRGPSRQSYRWLVDLIQLDVATGTIPRAALWRSSSPGGMLIARNLDGKYGTFTGGAPSDRILTGEVWSIEWTGATPGAVCRATLTGTEESEDRAP